MGDESNADFPVFAITSCLVAKIKNTNRKTKPFRTIIERPIAAWFWQEVYESLNQIVDAPFILRGGHNLSRLNLTPDTHEVCFFWCTGQLQDIAVYYGSADYIREIHDATPLHCTYTHTPDYEHTKVGVIGGSFSFDQKTKAVASLAGQVRGAASTN